MARKERSFAIVAYDIPDTPRRTRVAKALERYGERVQYSVFETNLLPDRFAAMRAEIEEVIDPEKDSVRIYQLCGACRSKIVLLGQGELHQVPDCWII